MSKLLFKLLVFLSLVFLLGCSDSPVVQEIDQSQANEIVAVLNQSGISSFAKKESGAKGKFTVRVKRGDYTQAVTILHRRGLPGAPRATFNELIAQSSLIPNSRELDSLKVDRAIATEIEDLLANHPEIVSSKVVVRSNYLKDQQQSAVSIMLQVKTGMQIMRQELLDSVLRLVPGIKSENIVLMIHDAELPQSVVGVEGAQNVDGQVLRVPLTPFLYFWRIPEDDYPQIAAVLVVCLLVFGSVGAVIGYWYRMYQHSQDFFDTSLPEVIQNRSSRSDRQRQMLAKLDSDEQGEV